MVVWCLIFFHSVLDWKYTTPEQSGYIHYNCYRDIDIPSSYLGLMVSVEFIHVSVIIVPFGSVCCRLVCTHTMIVYIPLADYWLTSMVLCVIGPHTKSFNVFELSHFGQVTFFIIFE